VSTTSLYEWYYTIGLRTSSQYLPTPAAYLPDRTYLNFTSDLSYHHHPVLTIPISRCPYLTGHTRHLILPSLPATDLTALDPVLPRFTHSLLAASSRAFQIRCMHLTYLATHRILPCLSSPSLPSSVPTCATDTLQLTPFIAHPDPVPSLPVLARTQSIHLPR